MDHTTVTIALIGFLTAAVLGTEYLKSRERRRRLEILHAERLTAMDKGIPLPEVPPDPLVSLLARTEPPADPAFWTVIGIIVGALGLGSMIAFSLVPRTQPYWPLPLPFALIGLGLLLYSVLASRRAV